MLEGDPVPFYRRFSFDDRVIIDDGKDVVAVVTAYAYRRTREPVVECSWMHAGTVQTHWIEEWRLSKAP